MRVGWVLVAAGLALAGCGGEPDVTPRPTVLDSGSPTFDAGSDAVAVPDAGSPDVREAETFGAPVPHLPLMDYLGGTLLTKVKIVTITFANDDPQVVARMNLMGDTLPQTPWWSASVSEYCVLPAGSPCIGPGDTSVHVALQENAPVTVTDSGNAMASDVVKFLQARIEAGTLPDPTEQTLYMIYYPAGTTITFEGQKSCQAYGAYHFSAELGPKGGGSNVESAYAIMPRCSGEPFLATAASHELMEAATDAHPSKDKGWVMQDSSFPLLGEENGDLCDHPWGSVFETVVDSTFTVQRGWSNVAARAGHDPCAPAAPQPSPWFMAGPTNQEIVLAVGETTKLDVWASADGVLADWALSAQDRSGGDLIVAIDKATANAGTHATLTITLKNKPKGGLARYGIVSQSGMREMHWGAAVRSK